MKKDFSISLARWCRRNKVHDCTFFSHVQQNTAYSWETYPDNCIREKPLLFESLFTAEDMEALREKGLSHTPGNVIGMITEGALNHAIHYGTDTRLRDRFVKFVNSRGWGLFTLRNCYNVLYRLSPVQPYQRTQAKAYYGDIMDTLSNG